MVRAMRACYRGWVVAIPIADPNDVQAWATTAGGGAIWGPGGIASDGSNIYATTGNTFYAADWAGGEAISPIFGLAAALDRPRLLGTDQLACARRQRFWIWAALARLSSTWRERRRRIWSSRSERTGRPTWRTRTTWVVSPTHWRRFSASGVVTGAHALYSTDTATYLVYRGPGASCTGGSAGTNLSTLKVVAGSPPTFAGSWCTAATGNGSPIVTTTDGRSEAIVWVVGAEGNELLQGFDGDTGATIFAGGATPIPGARHFTAPIAAKGRIFVAADDIVVAFKP